MSKTSRTPIESMEGYSDPSFPLANSEKTVAGSATRHHRLFISGWYAINFLLLLSVLSSLVCIGWEYSMRQYLRGFSDAVIPAQGSAEEKVQAILDWMSNGPARLPAGPAAASSDRDPTATLNYQALLVVCGTATNAFINLADSSGLTARRLLLLDQDHRAKHVVAEVLIDGRWVVVDPTFRFIPRGPDGTMLTRLDLANPAMLEAATKDVPAYSANYTYDRTAHIRLARLGPFGRILRRVLDIAGHGWEDSATTSLLVERQSYAAAVLSILSLIFFLIARVFFRWVGETWFGLHRAHFRDQLRRAAQAFLETTG